MQGSEEADELKIFFLPLFTTSHLIPMVDMARAFAAINGVDVTIITTPCNASLFKNSIDRDIESSGHRIKIRIQLVRFPSAQVGLPEGVENLSAATSRKMVTDIYRAITMLQPEIEQLFRDHRPDCIVSDMMYPWTADFAAQAGIPRLIGYATGYFPLCCEKNLELYQTHQRVKSETEKFELTGLPDKIEMTRSQLQDWVKTPSGLKARLMNAVEDSKLKTFGMVFNTFPEFESRYEEYYRKTMGMVKTWSIGPVSLLVNEHETDKAERGAGGQQDQDAVWKHCKAWLDSKQTNSVLYLNFGSMIKLSAAQLVEIAYGLEASGHFFLWVIRQKDDDDSSEEWSLEEVEKRFKESNKGFVIRNWAPQLLILEHPAVGGMVTHCGWNSVVEAVIAGLPIITWPISGEEFYNDKLLTDVHKIGMPVGVQFWNENWLEDFREVIKWEKIEKAVRFLMGGGEEAAEMRKRAEMLAVAAKKAVGKGGSSRRNLQALIGVLKSVKRARNKPNA